MIKFSREEKARIVPLIQTYFEEERGEEIGNLAAEFLLDFFISQIGPFIYNHAILDARAYLRKRIENIEEGLYEMEQPLPK